MNDLEQELRELFERKASDVRTPAGAPAAVLKRGRRRQVGTVALSAFTVLVVVVASIAGLHGVLRGTPSTHLGGGEPFTRTATIRGFTVTSPSDWTLIDEWPLATAIGTSSEASSSTTCTVATAGSQPCSPLFTNQVTPIPVPTGLPVFQLSNFDLGLDTSICGSGADVRESANAGLYVALDINRLQDLTKGPDLPQWPVRLDTNTPIDQGPCGPGRYAHFKVGDTPFFAYLAVGATASDDTSTTLFDAFNGMQAQPVPLSESPDRTPGYVIAGGEQPGGPWRMEARPYAHGVNLELIQVEKRVTVGDITLSAGLVFAAENTEPRFGVVTNEATGVQFRPAEFGPTIEGTIVALPQGLGVDVNAFYIEGVENISGHIFAIGPNGQPLNGKAETAGGSSTAAGTPTVEPSPSPSPGGAVIATGHDLGVDWTLSVDRELCFRLATSAANIGNRDCELDPLATTGPFVTVGYQSQAGALLVGAVPASDGAVSVRATIKKTGDVVLRPLLQGTETLSDVDFFVVPIAAPGPITLDFLDANGNAVTSLGFFWAAATPVASPS